MSEATSILEQSPVVSAEVQRASAELITRHLPGVFEYNAHLMRDKVTQDLKDDFGSDTAEADFSLGIHKEPFLHLSLPGKDRQVVNFSDVLHRIGETGQMQPDDVTAFGVLYNGLAGRLADVVSKKPTGTTQLDFNAITSAIDALNLVFPLHPQLTKVVEGSSQYIRNQKNKFNNDTLNAVTGDTQPLTPEPHVEKSSASESVPVARPKKWRRRAAKFAIGAGIAGTLAGGAAVAGKEYLQRGTISAAHTYKVDDIFAGVPDQSTSAQKPSALDSLIQDVGAPKTQKAPASETQPTEETTAPESQSTGEEPTATTKASASETAESTATQAAGEEKEQASTAEAETIATETLPPTATLEPTATPEPPPPPAPTEQAEVQIGDMNMAEFFLGETIKKALIKRKERYDNDAAFRERIAPELLQKDNLNMVYVGVDLTRDRPNEFNKDGNGLADVIMLLSVNPHTFETTVVSFPRDLFSPEVASYGHMDMDPGWGKINSATMLPKLDDVDSFEVIRKIVETATGAPIDMIYKTNIDFMKGYIDESGQKRDGVFDATVPGGIPVWLKTPLIDKEYPAENYGTRTASFPKGNQVLHGPDLVTIARMRHQDGNTFGREQRQRLIISSWVNELAKTILVELKDEDADKRFITINKVISGLEQLNQSGDLQLAPEDIKSGTDFLSMIRSMKNATEEVRNDFRALGALSTNSAGELNNLLLANTADIFTDFGFTAGEGKTLQPIPFPHDLSRKDQVYMLKVGRQNVGVAPGKREFNANTTPEGNHMDYWQGTRWQVIDTLLKH